MIQEVMCIESHGHLSGTQTKRFLHGGVHHKILRNGHFFSHRVVQILLAHVLSVYGNEESLQGTVPE